MSDKSNKYGYVGVDIPAQSFGSNKGVFNPAEINELVADNKWTSFGQLELIETQTATGLTTPNYIEFTDIKSNIYNVHFLTWSMVGTNSNPMYLQFRESGTWETATVYQYANQYGGTGGSFNEEKSTTSSYIHLGTTKADAGGASTQGYVNLYNLGDSTKYSFATYQSIKVDYFRFGSGVMTQASFVDGIRLGKTGSTSYDITGASLYGIRYS